MSVQSYVEDFGCTLGEELLKPTRIYVKQVLKAVETADVKGIAHITGGGFFENIPRIIPEGLRADIYPGRWKVPEVFKFIQHRGGIGQQEMFRTFNMGIGLVMAAAPGQAEILLEGLQSDGAAVIGRISPGTGGIKLWK